MPSPAEFSFGKYRVVRELGRGAVGVVYEAWQPDLDRRVALKLIRHSALHADHQRDRFLQEARAAARVQHPGVVSIYEVGIEAGQPWLAMEFVDGRSCAELVAAGPQPPAVAARLLLEIARAVADLHRHGIVHRDLKPQNVLVDADGRPRVSDFGLALLTSARGDGEHAAVGDDGEAVAGTPGYMAPEQLAKQFGRVGPRSDVYALGAMLYALLTGRGPHAGDDVLEVVMATLEHDVPSPQQLVPGVPAELGAICSRCLERQPDRRYHDAGALADDLERWLRGDTPEALPPGVWRRLSGFSRRHRPFSARAFAVLLFGVLTGVDHFALRTTSVAFFTNVSGVLIGMLLAAVLLDRWLASGRAVALVRLAWTTIDCVGFTWIAYCGDGVTSALLLLFPVLVLTAGLWLRTGLVLYATGLAMAAYAVLALLPDRARPGFSVPLDKHLAVLVTLVLTGVLVARQVARTRALHDFVVRRR